jgi:hypothetical protein
LHFYERIFVWDLKKSLMKANNRSQNDVKRSLVGLVMVFAGIVLSDVATGTWSVSATALMAGAIISSFFTGVVCAWRFW